MRAVAFGGFMALGISVLAVASDGWQTPSGPPSPLTPTAIVGARLIDGAGTAATDDSVVVVEGDRIRAAGPRARVQIPPGAAVVQANGQVLIPGLVDVHCHINQPVEDMKRYWIAQLRWGVTTMRSAGNDKPEAVPLFRQTRTQAPRPGSGQAGAFLAPRAYTAGQGFNVSGPYPGAPTFKPTSPDEARANVRSLKAQQVDFIKIWMTNPKFPPEVIAAIVNEGKTQGIPIVSHVTDVESLHQLADLGVTDFLHNPIEPVTPELVAYAQSKKLTFAPTLANVESRWFYYEHPEILRLPMLQDALYPRGKQMLADAERKAQTLSAPDFAQRKTRLREQTYPFIKAMSDAGVRVVTGTDCGAEASQVTPFGHATHREIQMFVEAGMTPLAAIRAATLDAARVITRSEDPDYGTIRAGKAADLVLLGADPTVDINNTIKIEKVMRAGQWVR
jgi:imidazolonepropionase-like amidohydrolase